MSLTDLANLGEFLGSVGVLISLIYLVIELRQNTAMMHVNASGARVARDAELNSRISDDPEFAALWPKDRGDFNTLEEAARIRPIFFNRSAIVH